MFGYRLFSFSFTYSPTYPHIHTHIYISGIGLATAELYVRSGACVAVVDIRQDRVESTVKDLENIAGGQSVVLGILCFFLQSSASFYALTNSLTYIFEHTIQGHVPMSQMKQQCATLWILL